MSEMPKYANAPVVLALIEIKHPRADLGRGDAIAVKNALRTTLPFHSSRDVMSRTVDLTPNGPIEGPSVTATWQNYDSRTRRTRLGCSAEATTLETTEYDRWQTLRAIAHDALTARHEVAPLDGYLRVGLRYIDEIRIRGESPPDWREWIAAPFLPPIPDGVELTPAQQNCVVQYKTGTPGQTVTVRFGAVDAPAAVAGELRPEPPGPGPYFLLDSDIAWETPSGEAVPEMDVEAVCKILDDLHAHASKMFEHVLTDKLREALA